MFLNNTVASATEHTCSRTSVQLWKPKSLLSTAVWYSQRINIRVLLHAKKICNLSYPLYSLLPLVTSCCLNIAFSLLKSFVSLSCQSRRAVWAESAISLATAATGCPSPPGFLVPLSVVSILPRLLQITLSFPVSLAFFGAGRRSTGVDRQAQHWPFFWTPRGISSEVCCNCW